MLKRGLIGLVAVLSASAPLMRGYCQLTCMADSTSAQASAAGAQHSCHDASSSEEAIIGQAGPGCGHRGESPVGSGNLGIGRLFSEDTQLAILLTATILAVDAPRFDAVPQSSDSPHGRSRPRPDVLRI
jgi:hypothetical protein